MTVLRHQARDSKRIYPPEGTNRHHLPCCDGSSSSSLLQGNPESRPAALCNSSFDPRMIELPFIAKYRLKGVNDFF